LLLNFFAAAFINVTILILGFDWLLMDRPNAFSFQGPPARSLPIRQEQQSAGSSPARSGVPTPTSVLEAAAVAISAPKDIGEQQQGKKPGLVPAVTGVSCPRGPPSTCGAVALLHRDESAIATLALDDDQTVNQQATSTEEPPLIEDGTTPTLLDPAALPVASCSTADEDAMIELQHAPPTPSSPPPRVCGVSPINHKYDSPMLDQEEEEEPRHPSPAMISEEDAVMEDGSVFSTVDATIELQHAPPPSSPPSRVSGESPINHKDDSLVLEQEEEEEPNQPSSAMISKEDAVMEDGSVLNVVSEGLVSQTSTIPLAAAVVHTTTTTTPFTAVPNFCPPEPTGIVAAHSTPFADCLPTTAHSSPFRDVLVDDEDSSSLLGDSSRQSTCATAGGGGACTEGFGAITDSTDSNVACLFSKATPVSNEYSHIGTQSFARRNLQVSSTPAVAALTTTDNSRAGTTSMSTDTTSLDNSNIACPPVIGLSDKSRSPVALKENNTETSGSERASVARREDGVALPTELSESADEEQGDDQDLITTLPDYDSKDQEKDQEQEDQGQEVETDFGVDENEDNEDLEAPLASPRRLKVVVEQSHDRPSLEAFLTEEKDLLIGSSPSPQHHSTQCDILVVANAAENHCVLRLKVDRNKLSVIVEPYGNAAMSISAKIDVATEQEEDQESALLHKFEKIIGHQGPLKQGDEGFKGSLWNVLIKWENYEDATYEPLNTIGNCDAYTCAIYARDNNLLDLRGWMGYAQYVEKECLVTEKITLEHDGKQAFITFES
jgi:hypothetical protein